MFQQENDPTANEGENGTLKDRLFTLAREAHAELLKQKMKEAFEAKIGKKMDKVADIAVDTCLHFMQDRMDQKVQCDDLENGISKIFKEKY